MHPFLRRVPHLGLFCIQYLETSLDHVHGSDKEGRRRPRYCSGQKDGDKTVIARVVC